MRYRGKRGPGETVLYIKALRQVVLFCNAQCRCAVQYITLYKITPEPSKDGEQYTIVAVVVANTMQIVGIRGVKVFFWS